MGHSRMFSFSLRKKQEKVYEPYLVGGIQGQRGIDSDLGTQCGEGDEVNATVQYLRGLLESGTAAGLSDGQLLGCFIDQGEESAFDALAQRHGPMVWGVCRRLLRDHHDAEDAFQ